MRATQFYTWDHVTLTCIMQEGRQGPIQGRARSSVLWKCVKIHGCHRAKIQLACNDCIRIMQSVRGRPFRQHLADWFHLVKCNILVFLPQVFWWFDVVVCKSINVSIWSNINCLPCALKTIWKVSNYAIFKKMSEISQTFTAKFSFFHICIVILSNIYWLIFFCSLSR